MNSGYLYARSYPINEHIAVTIPTVGQIWDNEAEYYGLVTAVIATPFDYMVQLDDIGIDFSKVSPFELFLLLFNGIKSTDTSLVFGELDLSRFQTAVNEQNGNIVLVDQENGAVIDRGIHDQIRRVLRQINHLESSDKRPGNEAARKYMIDRARVKQRRAARKPHKSQLEDLIVALVNTEQFKYGYEGTRDLTVYQFYASVYQIIKKIHYDQVMSGYYAGTIPSKELDKAQLNWLISK